MKQQEMLRELARIVESARNEEELETLLEGLLTPSETEEVMFRWQLMSRLIRGETQRDISRDLGVSLGKIARGSRLLKYELPEFRDLIVRYEREHGDAAGE